MTTAQVVLINKEGLVLGVSRKDDHNDFGLPGGKMEDIDNNDPMATAIRETKEETGLDITGLRQIFSIHMDNTMGYTYIAEYEGEINHDEPHVVKWVPFQLLINGKFGRYNALVSKSLDSMGVIYQKHIDEEALERELKAFFLVKYDGVLLFDCMTRQSNFFDDVYYEISLTYAEDSGFDDDDLEEGFEFDKVTAKQIDELGIKYGVRLTLDSYYTPK